MAQASITTPAKLSKTSLLIILYLSENEEATTKEIGLFFLDKTKEYVERCVYNLKKRGLIEKVDGAWALTPIGREVLESYDIKKLRKYLVPNGEKIEYIINNFNSPEVERIKCAVCGKVPLGAISSAYTDSWKYINLLYREHLDKFEYGVPIIHHISYRDNETVLVCSGCHKKIHQNKNHPFYPIDQKIRQEGVERE
jgi:hypothetical protein